MKTTFTRRMTHRVAAGGAVIGLVMAIPATAFAAPSTTTSGPTTSTTAAGPGATAGTAQPSDPRCTPSAFTQAQQQVEAALSSRVTQLNSLLSAVNSTTNHLTSGDQQTLQNDISSVELPGIEGLQSHVQQDTTCVELRSDAHSMVYTYRVYVVMTPQTHLSIVADNETYIEGMLVNLEPTLEAAIQNAKAHGKDVTAAQAAFNDLQGQVTSAQGATDGLSAQVLAQTPQGYPGNWQVFMAAHTGEANAHTDLHAAYLDAQQIRNALK